MPSAPRRVTIAGLVITRQRPGTASGVVFLTLEDETGCANVVVWKTMYDRFRRAVIGGRLLQVTGRVQRDGQVIHVIAEQIDDISPMLGQLGGPAPLPANDDRGDEVRRAVPSMAHGTSGARHPREQARKLFPSRDFH